MTELRERDAEARRLAQMAFDAPLLLEAGAGTGKTAVLVARIVAWCLGPGWERSAGRLDPARASSDREVAVETLRRVVAITFTEAAAAEMSARVAQALLALHRGDAPVGVHLEALPQGAVRRRRAEALVEVLDQLTARTIHAFCRRLLLAHPLEAGLHPELRVDADGQRQAEVAREVIEARLPEAFGDPPDPDFAALVDAGVGPGELEQALCALLAEGAEARDLAEEALGEAALHAFHARLEAALQACARLEGGRLVALDRKARKVSALAQGLCELAAAVARGPHDEAAWSAVREAASSDTAKELRKWGAANLGAHAQEALGADLEGFAASCRDLLPLLRFAVRLDLPRLACARRVLAALLESATARLRAEGVEGFGGLLRRARDLLVERPEVAARARRRIDQLLVDEFQDTDATQCELLERLAFPAPGEDAAERPGLFLVGDPKQSIYGWRNAELRAYERFRTRVGEAGGRVLPLAVNHRSAPAILDEVARAVEPVMRETAGLQPAFEQLLAGPAPRGGSGYRDGARTPVEHWVSWTLREDGAPEPATLARRASEIEARAVAQDLAALRAAGVALDDTALLMRSTSDFEIYLSALREAGIPFVVERETTHYQRREVVDATAVVRCVLDVHDQLALVAALRSPWVGVPDAALIPLWRRDFPELVAGLDGRSPAALAAACAAAAAAATELPKGVPGLAALHGFEASLQAFLVDLAALRRLHDELPPDRFVEALRRRLLPEAAEAGRFLGPHRVAHLDRLFRDLLEALEQGAGSAAAVASRLRRAGSMQREHSEGRARSLVRGAVQVMTIHRAKGLDFEHVYLLQTHKGTPRERGRRSVVVRGQGRAEYELLGLPTPGLYEADLHRAAVEEHERVRLLYVALTRARSRLVVAGGWPTSARDASTHAALLRRRRGTPPDLAGWLASAGPGGAVADADGVLWRLPALAPERPAEPHPPSSPVTPHAERAAQDAGRLRELGAASEARRARPFARRASDQETLAELRAKGLEPGAEAERGDAAERADALAAGSAVHAWLEGLDLAARASWCPPDPGAWPELAPGGAARARAVIERFLAGPLAGRLASLGERVVARELPVLLAPEEVRAPSETDQPVGFWSGAIDLLYLDAGSGAPVVVDYKTDAVEGESELAVRARAYAGQGAVYTRAVQRALGLALPPRFELWFLHAGQVVPVPLPPGP